MQIFINAPQDLAGLTLAGKPLKALLSQRLSILPGAELIWVQADTQLQAAGDRGCLWIEGWFPLLDVISVLHIIGESEHKGNATFMPPGHPELGLFYARAGQALPPLSLDALQELPNVTFINNIQLDCLASRKDYGRLNRLAFDEKLHQLAKQGVLITAPGQTWVELDVEVAAGAVIEPNVFLGGASQIAAGARIGMGAWLRDVNVAADAEIKPYSVLQECVVGPRCSVGPFAHVRPGSVLGEDCRVGNFVETKKVQMGNGSKASHLTYLGDAVIGQDCNIGAGTITCNYDGYNKHTTQLGDRVFIGSGSQLVAPLTVKDNAFVAAGSTITHDVEADALAIARAKQVDKAGRAVSIRQAAAKKAAK